MLTKTVEVRNSTGLHARPAACLAKAAKKCSCCIDSREVRKKPGGYWIIRDLTGLDLVGLASL